MIGSENIRINRRCGNLFRQSVGHQEIIDSPSCIVFPGIEPVAPPAVHSRGIGIAEPEGIRKTCLQELAEAFPLLIGKTGIPPVAGGILQIDFLMGNIQVAADNDGLVLV